MKLRPLSMSDADFMLTLKNDPKTREFAIASHQEIQKDTHYEYLKKNLEHFQAIVDGENIVGAIRIYDYEVSVWVGRDFWKRGIATYILQHIAKRGMTARIVDGNVASMKAFGRAGFEPIEYVKANNSNYYIFKKH